MRQGTLTTAGLIGIIPYCIYALSLSAIPPSPQALRDPTRPIMLDLEAKSIQSDGLQLQSTLVDNTRRIALINNTFAEVGDTIGTAKIIAINDGYVVLIDSGHPITLYLFDTDIRK